MDDKIKKSLRYSLIDGMFASVMQGLSETFITPYALAMKASTAVIGILASMPNLVGSLLQIKSAPITERFGSRLALINAAVLVHAFLWIPIIAIPYVFAGNRLMYLIIFYTLFISIGTLAFPAWSSLMADHVPDNERGRVFGFRSRIFGFINISSMLMGGSILYLVKALLPGGNNVSAGSDGCFLGFTVIFSAAFLARLMSWHFLTKMYEPPLIIKDEHRFTFTQFLRRMTRSNFGRFVIFVASMNFSAYLAAPFFPVYMLRDLKFDYLTYTVLSMAATLTTFAMMNVWGRYADAVGNMRIMKLVSIFIPVIPLFWLFSHNVIYLITVQIFAGSFWAGFNLSASNFLYDAVTPQKRTRCVAYFNVVNGVAIFSGAMVGGFLSTRLPHLFGYRILALLVVSAVFRSLAAQLSRFVKEVRKVKDITNLELFYSIIGLRPDLRQKLFMTGAEE